MYLQIEKYKLPVTTKALERKWRGLDDSFLDLVQQRWPFRRNFYFYA